MLWENNSFRHVKAEFSPCANFICPIMKCTGSNSVTSGTLMILRYMKEPHHYSNKSLIQALCLQFVTFRNALLRFNVHFPL